MFLIILILLVCVTLRYRMVCHHFLPRDNKLVPTCPGKLPIVGHCHMFLNKGTLIQNLISFGEYALKAGGVAKMFMGPVPAYVVSDPVDVATVLNKCLKKMFVYRFAEVIAGKMFFCAKVPIWKRNRRIVDLSFKQNILDTYLELFNDQAERFVELISEDVGKGEIDLTESINKIVLETACQTTLGGRVDGKALVDDNIIHSVRELQDIVLTRVIKPWLVSDFIFNASSYKTKLTKALKTATNLTEQMVELRKSEYLQRLKNTEVFHNEGRTFQSVLETLIENTMTDTSGLFTDAELSSIAWNILVGAFDTTINEMLFCVACISSYREVQEKIYQEIIQVLGEDGRVTKQNISQLVYLEAAIKESIRLYPVTAVVGREATVDTKLRNVTIPAGSSVIVHIWSTNRNTKYWGSDAEEFKPERWLSSDTAPSHKAAFATFSPGVRGCIGKTYAIMFLKVTMALTLRRFKLTGDHTKMKILCEILLKPEHLVTVEERRK